MAESNRMPRDAETRERTRRRWTPPQLLPDPAPEPGYVFRWVRISTMNQADATNISSKLREGWEPVKASLHPEMQMLTSKDARFPDSIEIGGLLLCKIPKEMADERDAYYREKASAEMQSVDQNFMRESDPRMPLFSDKRSKVSFGSGS